MAKTKPCWAKVTGPLAEYADGFRAELFRLGYTPLTAACQLRLTAHLSRWMTAEGLGTQDLDMPAAERYFAARRSAGYANERTVEALGPLLGYLRRLGAAPLPPAEPATETSLLLDRFAAYLASERGLAPTTVALNVRLARPFLQQRALERDGRLDLEQLTAGEVRAFVLDRARKQPRSAKRIVTALRSLLRFLHVDGVLAVPLAGAVPSPAGHCAGRAAPGAGARAGRGDAGLLRPGHRDRAPGPGGPADAVPDGAAGRRSRRARPGRHRLAARRDHGPRQGRAPRPAAAALPTWARRSSPTCATAARPARWTGRCSSPPRPPGKRWPISGSPRSSPEAAARAGIPGPVHAHRLRHSAATAMLRGGGSLTEIGQALRHARPATTAIYAKVDVDALRPLGRPWPGQEETA